MLTFKQIKTLELNPYEYAFTVGVRLTEAKQIFAKILNKDKAKAHHTLPVLELTPLHTAELQDFRYKGINQLLASLHKLSKGQYHLYLLDRSVLQANKFTGGKAVFYKLMTDKEKQHASDFIESARLNHLQINTTI